VSFGGWDRGVLGIGACTEPDNAVAGFEVVKVPGPG